VRTHTNLQLDHRLELYEAGMLPWDLEMTVEEPLSDDEDEDGVPHSVSDSESESENDSDQIFASCDTEGIRLFFYFIFSIIFTFYLHIFVYILSAEPVHTDSTRSSLKPQKNTCFFVRHLNFRDVYSKKKKIPQKNPHITFTGRAPHVRLSGEFTSQPYVRCGILGTHGMYRLEKGSVKRGKQKKERKKKGYAYTCLRTATQPISDSFPV
jgi:hypothetical protein